MASKPNWAEVLSAISAFISTIALTAVAIISNNLQAEIKNLTFPPPRIDFQFSEPIDVIHRPTWSEREVDESEEIELHVEGFSQQAIEITRVGIEDIVWPEDQYILIPYGREPIFIEMPDASPIRIMPSEKGFIDFDSKLLLNVKFMAETKEDLISILPMNLELIIRVDWFEFRSGRAYSNRIESTIRIDSNFR